MGLSSGAVLDVPIIAAAGTNVNRSGKTFTNYSQERDFSPFDLQNVQILSQETILTEGRSHANI